MNDDSKTDGDTRQDDKGREVDDASRTAPATSGHSDADSQAERNHEDESPA